MLTGLNRSQIRGAAAAAAAIVLSVVCLGGDPMGNVVTYQGQLKQGGVPYNGDIDVSVIVWDVPDGGQQTLAKLNFTAVPCIDGIFSIEMTFNDGVFNGDARWLEIGVRPTGNGKYVTLQPRQLVAAAPYALKSLTNPSALDASDGSPAAVLASDAEGNLQMMIDRYFGVSGEDAFDYKNRTLGHYSLGWFGDPDNSGGGTGWQSAYSGFKWFASGFPRMSLSQDGKLGIGTISPETTLHLASNGNNINSIITIDSGESTAKYSAIDFRDRGASRWGLGLDPAGDFYLDRSNVGRVITVDDANSNVGIAANPTSKLTVGGEVYSTNGGYRFPDGTVQTTAAGGGGSWALNGDKLYNTNTGSVGIGTNNPIAPFQIGAKGGISSADDGQFQSTYFGTNFYVNNETFNHIDWNRPAAYMQIIPDSSSDRMFRFYHYEAGGESPKDLMILGRNKSWVNTEYFGIRDTTPEYTLDVNGTTRTLALIVQLDAEVQGTTTTGVLVITGGSDIAEPFDIASADEIQPGMVTCIDPANPGGLVLSNKAYDRTVAGVISGAGGVNVGLTLTQKDSIADGKHPVALTGRVYVWVDADTGGPVVPGDLLTTSNTPGHAMKVTDIDRAQGATIGKAMTELQSGKGLVLVLVNLH